MRKVLRNHREVAHVWAQQNQDYGKSGNMFFEGPSIYSYGHHFEIARFITPSIVFFTNKKYSISTSNHMGYTLNALSSACRVFTVPSFGDHRANLAYYVEEAENMPIKIKRARSNAEWMLNKMQKLIASGEDYISSFRKMLSPGQITKAKEVFDKLMSGNYSDIIAKQEKARKLQLQKERERAEIRKKEVLSILEEWKAGKNVEIWSMRDLPTYLRIKGGEIQTSHGASVPLNKALEMYKQLKKGIPVHGFKMGNYTITSFDGETLKVGCHTIPMAEMDRLYAIVEKMLAVGAI